MVSRRRSCTGSSRRRSSRACSAIRARARRGLHRRGGAGDPSGERRSRPRPVRRGLPEIVAPFELKGAGTRDLDAIMPGRSKSPVQQAWEYAMGARGVKWVLVSNYVELRLYGFGEGTTAFETFRLDRLTDPREYARFMLLLSADNLLSGRTRELLEDSRREDRDITDSVYRDYRDLRHTLIAAVRAADTGLDPLAGIATAQKVLDRVLFIAFAEDTGLLPRNTLGDAFKNRDPYNPRPVWDNFLGLFKAIDQGSEALRIPRYNGGLFEADAAIDGLSLPDPVCEGFHTIGATTSPRRSRSPSSATSSSSRSPTSNACRRRREARSGRPRRRPAPAGGASGTGWSIPPTTSPASSWTRRSARISTRRSRASCAATRRRARTRATTPRSSGAGRRPKWRPGCARRRSRAWWTSATSSCSTASPPIRPSWR